MKRIAIATLSLASGIANASMAIVIPHDASGHIGQNIKIESMYQYRIDNNSNTPQMYVGFEELEVNGKSQKHPLSFTVGPYSTKSENGDFISFGYTPTEAGNYKIHSSIKINGMNGAAHNFNSTLSVTR